MSNREDFLTLKAHIEQKGGTDVTYDASRRGNPRIYFIFRGLRRFITTTRSPSDVRSIENNKSFANQLFADIINITPNYVEQAEEEEVKTPSLEKTPETFGERLQYAREQQQLSRERLADLSGIDEELIKRFEVTKQETLRDIKTALLLSSALNLTLSYLVGERTAREISVSETELFNPAIPKIDEIAKAIQAKKEPPKEEQKVQPSSNDQVLYDSVNTLEEFADFFRFIRTKKGLKQMEIAKALHMQYPSEVSRIERGLWAGGVYQRHESLAKILDIPPVTMKSMIDRVVKSAGPSPSNMLLKKRGFPKPKVSPPEPEPKVVNATGPTPGPSATELHVWRNREQPVHISPLETERLVLVIREQAEITRSLLVAQHEELLKTLKQEQSGFDPAEVMHTIVKNLFRKD